MIAHIIEINDVFHFFCLMGQKNHQRKSQIAKGELNDTINEFHGKTLPLLTGTAADASDKNERCKQDVFVDNYPFTGYVLPRFLSHTHTLHPAKLSCNH